MRALLVLLLLAGLSTTVACGRKGALEPPAGTAQDAGTAGNEGETSESWQDEEEQWPPPLPEGRERHTR